MVRTDGLDKQKARTKFAYIGFCGLGLPHTLIRNKAHADKQRGRQTLFHWVCSESVQVSESRNKS